MFVILYKVVPQHYIERDSATHGSTALSNVEEPSLHAFEGIFLSLGAILYKVEYIFVIILSILL